ncbi:hypothetical protein KSP40_PGU007555 [Platanthera guangdongensis]|uniref:DNA polymerase delta subunit 4 n=1 Tax=Platanthera guangdongensis TaxID=2320717 RepID=A0ABR2MTE0_9ASPA
MASGGINRFYKERKKSSVAKPSPSFKDKKSVGSPTATVGALIPSEDDGSEDRLRQFDLDWRYGPCIGMTRMERWNRATEMGLQPPTDVKHLLLRSKSGDERAASEIPCLWAGRN